jgi:hypothetical protein
MAALSSVASGYIHKPFTPREAREQIVPVLARRFLIEAFPLKLRCFWPISKEADASTRT